MTISGMAPGYPCPVRTFPEGGKDEFGAHPSAAWQPDHLDVCRVLHPADPRKVGCPVGALVAEKTNYFWFPVAQF